MKIIRGRLKSFGGGKSEFISIKGRIKGLIKNNPGDTFDFVIDDKNIKTVKTFGPDDINPELVGKSISIIDDVTFANFKDDGTIEITEGSKLFESLPRKSTVDQLKRIRKVSKGTDIGDKITDMGKEGANIQYIKNPIDTGIESYENFQKNNKNFKPNWNLKHLKSPFNESVSTDLGEDIAKDLFDRFNALKNAGESVTVADFDRYMKERGSNIDLSHSVMNYLVDMGFDFDVDIDDEDDFDEPYLKKDN